MFQSTSVSGVGTSEWSLSFTTPGTICSVQPAASSVARASPAIASAGEEHDQEDDAECHQPGQGEAVDDPLLTADVVRARRRAPLLGRLHAARRGRCAILTGHDRPTTLAAAPARLRVPSGPPPTLSGPMQIVALVTGLLLGALGVWLALRVRLAAGDAAQAVVRERERELAAALAELDVERRSVDQRLATAAKTLSADALKESNASFLALAETKLQGYVQPLKESLDKVDGHVRVLEQDRHRAFGALRQELLQLREGQERLRSATGSLTTALRAPARPRTVGRGRAA